MLRKSPNNEAKEDLKDPVALLTKVTRRGPCNDVNGVLAAHTNGHNWLKDVNTIQLEPRSVI